MPTLCSDLDNTLVDRSAGYRVWTERFTAEMGSDPEEVPRLVRLDAVGVASREIFEEVRRGGAWPPRWPAWSGSIAPPVPPEMAGRLARPSAGGMADRHRDQRTPPPSGSTFRSAVSPLLVDAGVVSDEIGICEPDRRIFEAAR